MGIPNVIAADDGGELKRWFKELLDAERIDHIIMATHLSFIDRFTRIIKHMVYERVQHTKKEWHSLLTNVINQYDNT